MTDVCKPDFPDTATLLAAVSELSNGFRQEDSIAALCRRLHSRILPLLGNKASELYLHDPLLDRFTPPADHFGVQVRSRPPGVPAFIDRNEPSLPLHSPSPMPVILGQASPSVPENLAATGNASHLVVPVRTGASVSALIYCGSPEPDFFQTTHRDAVAALAAAIGFCLQHIKTIESLKMTVSTLEHAQRVKTAQIEIGEQIHETGDLEELCGALHRIVSGLLVARNFFIVLEEKNDSDTFFSFPYYSDIHDTRLQGTRFTLKPGEIWGLTDHLLESGEPLLTTPDNFEAICRANNITFTGTRPTSWLGVPFRRDQLTGAVVVLSYDDTVYTEKDRDLLSDLATPIGGALASRKRLDDLYRAKTRAEIAEKNKSAFLASMSHEIRTPMNGIIGMTDLVLDMQVTERQRTYLNMVRSSADRLLTLINDILDFSKIEAGKLDLQAKPFLLRDTLTDSLSMMELHADQKGLKLLTRMPENIPALLVGDPNRLCQVLLNLVNNAIKFTDKGEVRISIARVEETSSSADAITLQFTISDTGIGIPADQQETIFDAFRQADDVKNGSYGGTGLGLAVTAQLVEMMGGRIWFDSAPGIGSRFHFTVRLAVLNALPPAPDDREASSQTPATRQARGMKVLLAEDDPINRTLAVAILEREGWQVETVVNGREALEELSRHNYDLVLMDMQMPEMDGYEATRVIRSQETGSNIHLPIIAMTAFAVKGDREKCLDAGMDGYISKPIDSEFLRAEIESIVSQTKRL